MKPILIVSSLLFLCNCSNPPAYEVKENKAVNELIPILYGQTSIPISQRDVRLNLDSFSTWDQLGSFVNELGCQGKNPYIKFESPKGPKAVYLFTVCYKNFICRLIRPKNIILINENRIHKNNIDYPLDSFYSILKRDIYNQGRHPHYSRSPEQLFIHIDELKNPSQSLPNLLDMITRDYFAITKNTDVKIFLQWME